MRIFSVLNVMLLLVIMATHEGAHLDNLLTPSQAKWLHEGSKMMMTGQIDSATIAMIMKSAKEQAAQAKIPANIVQSAPQIFDFAAESRGGSAMSAAPANYSAPAAAAVPSADIDQALAGVLASLQNS